MAIKRLAVIVAALSPLALAACVETTSGAWEGPGYGHGPGAHYGYESAAHRGAILSPGQVAERLRRQGYRDVERVTYRPAEFWRARGIRDPRYRDGAYVAEVDRRRRSDVLLVVNPRSGAVIGDWRGRV